MAKISVSSAGKLFFSRAPKNGRVQRAFREQIGRPVGQCMQSLRGTHPGAAAVRRHIQDCTRQFRGTRLSL